ncbi:cytochrome b [Solimonas soli]|uniref:cytochrome b n=1 Tax=Solimonas soli TaxID=413479 RepID=UPI0004B84B64|nr:cytochrome b [Solimonas soli]
MAAAQPQSWSNPASVPAAYSLPARLAHWLVALLILVNFCVAWTMVDMKLSPAKLKLFNYHKWIGVTVFLLAVLRLSWRLYRRPPALPEAMRAWEKRAAEITHRLLYLLLFAIPLSGWLMSSAKGFQTVYLGKLPIPDLLGKNAALGAALTGVHEALTWLLLGLLALHVAAALKHHFIDRDDVLRRMLPWTRA